MSVLRSIKRNIVRNEIGSNDIADAWYRLQVAKYGPERYCIIRNKNRKVVKIGKRIHKVGEKFFFTKKGIQTQLTTN